MKKIIPYLVIPTFMLVSFYCKAQTYGIVKAQAFLRQSTAGNIPVDDTGHPTTSGVMKNYLIYIETKGSNQPQWETAFIDGLPYSIQPAVVSNLPVKLGQLKGQQKTITINKGSANQLWQLMVSPQEKATSTSAQAGKAITLHGRYRGKAFSYRITKVQELEKSSIHKKASKNAGL